VAGTRKVSGSFFSATKLKIEFLNKKADVHPFVKQMWQNSMIDIDFLDKRI
jgi:hypothetical protein